MAERFRVLVADFLDRTEVEAPILEDLADIVLAGGRAEEDLFDLVPEADAVIVFHAITEMTDATFARATRCRGVVRAGVGYNNVDVAAASRRGIVVCNVPDYGTEEVADHALMLLLAVVRQLIPSVASIRGGGWDYGVQLDTRRLRGRTLGLVGCGRIGTAMTLRAKAFGLDVVFYDPHVAPGLEKALGVRRAARLEELLAQSPLVSLHCYLDETTHHLIDATALARMPRGGVLINTARGPLVDQVALVEALDSELVNQPGLGYQVEASFPPCPLEPDHERATLRVGRSLTPPAAAVAQR